MGADEPNPTTVFAANGLRGVPKVLAGEMRGARTASEGAQSLVRTINVM